MERGLDVAIVDLILSPNATVEFRDYDRLKCIVEGAGFSVRLTGYNAAFTLNAADAQVVVTLPQKDRGVDREELARKLFDALRTIGGAWGEFVWIKAPDLSSKHTLVEGLLHG